MRILQLAPRLPYPLTDGGAIGIYKPTEAIARLGQDITFVTYRENNASLTKQAKDAFSEFCHLELVNRPLPSRNSVLLRTMFSGAYPIKRRMMPEMFSLIETLITSNNFDVVHIDGAQMGKYGLWIKERWGLPVILREHNFEAQIYRRFASNSKNPVEKIIAAIHSKRVLREETKFLNGMDAVIAISDEDEYLMKQAAPKAKFWVIPAGVDTEYFALQPNEEKGNSILWIGGTNWRPNLDAIEFFAKEIFPLIVKAIPEATFDIVGENTDRLQHIANSGVNSIRLHGRVPDIRPFMAQSAVMICPLRVGGGMRLKLLDFFAAGKAVVSTHIGAEGNLAQDGEHILLRDDKESFAQAVIMLLKDENLRKRLGANARALAEREYSWDSIGKRFCEVYGQVIAAHHSK
jgi:glycosyltransferase involved in cell wall biosynthesis